MATFISCVRPNPNEDLLAKLDQLKAEHKALTDALLQEVHIIEPKPKRNRKRKPLTRKQRFKLEAYLRATRHKSLNRYAIP